MRGVLVLGTIGIAGIAVAWPLVLRPAPTRVIAVYPVAVELPANLLRFYVEFSAPMREDVALQHTRLLDDSGRIVQDAFLELREELWDPSRRRLTLLLDPGRIKRGLRSNQELGAPLVAGRQYRLIVGGDWPDATGHPLMGPFEKRFRVGSADRTPVRPEAWEIAAPRLGTRDPIRVQFEKPLDHALARGSLRVVDHSGAVIEGRAALVDEDRAWMFTSTRSWATAVAYIQIDPRLEDVAGNSVARAFDVDRRTAGAAGEMGGSTEHRSLRVQLLAPDATPR